MLAAGRPAVGFQLSVVSAPTVPAWLRYRATVKQAAEASVNWGRIAVPASSTGQPPAGLPAALPAPLAPATFRAPALPPLAFKPPEPLAPPKATAPPEVFELPAEVLGLPPEPAVLDKPAEARGPPATPGRPPMLAAPA